MKAHRPTWANSPDYTLHATTTKPDDSTHKAVFDIFDTDKDKKAKSPTRSRHSSESDSKKGSKKNESTSRL